MKQSKKTLLAIVLVITIGAMVFFIFSRYSSTTSLLSTVFQDVQPVDVLESSSFSRTFDTEGDHLVDITAQVVDIQQRLVSETDELHTFLILQSTDVSESFEVDLGPDKKHFFFRDKKLQDQANGDKVIIGSTLSIKEIRSRLTVRDSVIIQFRFAPEHGRYADELQAFFTSKNNVAPSVHYNFILNLTLLS